MKFITSLFAATALAAAATAAGDSTVADKGPIFAAFEQVELRTTQVYLRTGNVTTVQLRQCYNAAELCRALGGREVLDATLFGSSAQSSSRGLAAAIVFNADRRQGRTPDQIYSARDLPLSR